MYFNSPYLTVYRIRTKKINKHKLKAAFILNHIYFKFKAKKKKHEGNALYSGKLCSS